jgi:hypothetical protein
MWLLLFATRSGKPTLPSANKQKMLAHADSKQNPQVYICCNTWNADITPEIEHVSINYQALLGVDKSYHNKDTYAFGRAKIGPLTCPGWSIF